MPDAPDKVLLSLRGLRGAERGRDADWFNKVQNFRAATDMALETQEQAFLLVELAYNDYSSSDTPPPNVRLLYNGVEGGCPSYIQHQAADWWPRFEDGTAYGLDNVYRPSAWTQRLILGSDGPLPLGLHYVALLGSADWRFLLGDAARARAGGVRAATARVAEQRAAARTSGVRREVVFL